MATMRKWEVLLDRGQGNPLVPLQTVYLVRESELDVREALRGYEDMIRAIGCVGVLVPEEGWLNKEEAGEYLDLSPAALDKFMGSGLLDKAVDGYPKWKREWLDAFQERRMRRAVDLREVAA